MTDILDLYDVPQERLAAAFHAFVDKLQLEHTKEEDRLDAVIESARTRLHRIHLKAQYEYKRIYDEILIKLNNEADVEILRFFEAVIRSKRKDLYAQVFERATSVIQDIEKNGGNLEVHIDRDGSLGCGSMLYSDRKGGYFSFLGEFLDGYDDDIWYKVERKFGGKEAQEKRRNELYKSSKEWYELRERMRGRWTLGEEEVEAAIKEGKGALKEVGVEEAMSDVLGGLGQGEGQGEVEGQGREVELDEGEIQETLSGA